jgi:predicted hydrocarbon binding protein
MRFVRISQKDLEKIKRLYESVMSQASYGLFYREGNTLGKEIADMAGEDEDKFIETAARLIKGRGWVEEIAFNGDSVIAKGSIESIGSSPDPTCHRLRGMVHAIVERATERKLICLEEKCKSVGDSYCEFVMREMEEGKHERSEKAD